MKVALLSDCYPPRMGGIETQVRALAEALSADGHEVVVCTLTAQDSPETGPVRVHRLGPRRELPRGLLLNPRAGRELRRVLAAGGFDVVHAHLGVIGPLAMSGVAAAQRLGMPVVVTWHSITAGMEPVVRVAGYPRRWAERGAALSAVSRTAAAPLERLTGAPVAVLPNVVDTAFWRPAIDAWRAAPRQDGVLHVVSAMRMARRKRPGALIGMVDAVRARTDHDVRLTIAGDGPQWRRLAARAPSWCALPGRLSAALLRDLYAGADVYAAPTVLEAYGIAAAEALAGGLPVITPRRSAVAELVRPERTGLVVADDRGFTDALARLAAEPDFAARLRAEAAEAADHAPDAAQLSPVLALYRRATGGHAPDR